MDDKHVVSWNLGVVGGGEGRHLRIRDF